ncbi:hypothetical protein K3495_g7507 [Podosphaera aphanis]|nr:hypothetical protein K3495_g7507 [Podosphaera aphanis]
MEEQVNRLVAKIRENYARVPPDQRLLIAIAGVPGSGKTTLATTVVRHLNAGATTTPVAAYLPMDGYHLTRAQLDQMADPGQAHARRGAAFTFDAAGLGALVQRLRDRITPTTHTAPSFSHADQDPIPDAIRIAPSTRIIVLEGNYLALDRPGWREIAAAFDERWFVDVSLDRAADRLVRRHVRAGLAPDEAAAWIRVRENDLLNAREIVAARVAVDEVIPSCEDEAFARAG